MNRIKDYLVKRLSEPSTWRGIILLLTSCGASIEPTQAESIIFIGLFVAGLLGALTPDKKD